MKIQEGLGPCVFESEHDFHPRYDRILNSKAMKFIENIYKIYELGGEHMIHELLEKVGDVIYICDICENCGAVVVREK